MFEDYALTNKLRSVNTELKLFFGLGSLLLCVFSPSPLTPILIALTMAIVLILFAEIKARFYLKILTIPLSFGVISSLIIMFMYGRGDILLSFEIFGKVFDINRDGANLSVLVLSRMFGGVSCLFFIALTTPMVEMFAVFKRLKVPDAFLELSMMIYRYIFVFLDEALMIHTAQTMRHGYNGIKNSIRSFSMLGSVLFVRAWERGENLIVSMDSRCYNGKLDVLRVERSLSPVLLGVVIFYEVVMGVISYLTSHLMG